MLTVYILQSIIKPDRYYIGITDNLAERLEEHNTGECFHTSKFQPWNIILSINFSDPAKAKAFEKYLKSGSGRAFTKKHF